ncbi:MAG: UvrD-helicase domain-containing protein [Spirochaetes bacterium]|nr:UvrD-helicase domain-containing protein [Spirochaetota bacterium]
MPPVNLNAPQKQAVEHLRGPLLILAGAGSGKTRVITHRAARLIQSGVQPKNLLCVTFTNKAAREMKERVSEMCGEAGKAIPVMTFHAFCVRVLKKDIHHLGLSPAFTICDSEDQRQLFYETCRDIGVDIREIPDDAIRSRISLAKNECIPPGTPLGDDLVSKMATIIYPRYQAGLRRLNALDFDDLLMLTTQIMEEHPEVAARYQRQYKQIQVDEYQDTNAAQYRILRQIAAHGNVAVVGDDDQSIYSWRGADITNISKFLADFPGATVVKLEENYRSTVSILKAANAVIANNPERTEKALWSRLGQGAPLNTLQGEDPWDEAEKIADDLGLRNLKEGIPWKRFAVLYRTHTQSRPLEEVFQRHQIPYQISGKLDFYDRREVKDVLAYLKVLNSPADDLSFLRVINYPKRGIGDQSVALIKELALHAREPIFEGMKRVLDHPKLKVEVRKEMAQLVQVITQYGPAIQGPKMHEPIREFLGVIDFWNEIEREPGEAPAKQKRKEAVEQLIESIGAYAKKARKPSLSDYLMKLALFFTKADMEEEDEFEQNAVHLLTIHASKGLEYPHVYLPGFEEYLLPFSREVGVPIGEKAVQEERRLAYVAMTRAQETLCLTVSASRRRAEGSYAPEPSRFLAEIPDELILRNYGTHIFTDKPAQDDGPTIDVAKLALDKMRARLAGG